MRLLAVILIHSVTCWPAAIVCSLFHRPAGGGAYDRQELVCHTHTHTGTQVQLTISVLIVRYSILFFWDDIKSDENQQDATICLPSAEGAPAPWAEVGP